MYLCEQTTFINLSFRNMTILRTTDDYHEHIDAEDDIDENIYVY